MRNGAEADAEQGDQEDRQFRPSRGKSTTSQEKGFIR